jgi:hypothetical protein
LKNAASGNDNHQVDASTLFIQQPTMPQWKCNPPKHHMLAEVPQQQQTTSTKSRTRGLFSAHTSDNKQQATTTKHAITEVTMNDTGRSHCQESTQGRASAAAVMTSTKSRTRLFSQTQPPTTSNKQQATSTMAPEDLTTKNEEHQA